MKRLLKWLAELKPALAGVGPGVRAIVFPTSSEAFRAHPLLAGELARAGAVQEARIRAIKDKAAAFAADVADD